MTPHPEFQRLYQTIKDHPDLFTSWDGRVLRRSAPRWLSRPYRFTGAGSVITGGRWSVKKLMPSIYAATDPDTSNAEAHHKGRRYGWTDQDFNVQLTVGMRWRFERVLDLTNASIRRTLHISLDAIDDCNWVMEQTDGKECITQAIARAAFENLAEALVVPSARHKGGINLVYYPSHRLAGTVIETLDEANLPPDMHGL